jgi:2-polyprenyl-3-methyl-5-hydroxy-6-metoxy-1,4-benzoquinol methylase
MDNPFHRLAAMAVLTDNHGERMVPETTGVEVFWEHVYRYAFATKYVAGKRVLDVACGEGYGSAALQRAGAAYVVGVDINEVVCAHANRKYGIETRQGTAEELPLPNSSVDVIVSFETIEHVPKPLRFLDECLRVLTDRGMLIISTPNKGVYGWRGGVQNPHHCSEMTAEEFEASLRARFRDVRLYTQRPRTAHWWSRRALAAEEMPGSRIGILRRLQRSARFRLAPWLYSGPPPTARSSPVDAIARISRKKHTFLNPFVVRPRRESTGEVPIYLIATATR